MYDGLSCCIHRWHHMHGRTLLPTFLPSATSLGCIVAIRAMSIHLTLSRAYTHKHTLGQTFESQASRALRGILTETVRFNCCGVLISVQHFCVVAFVVVFFSRSRRARGAGARRGRRNEANQIDWFVYWLDGVCLRCVDGDGVHSFAGRCVMMRMLAVAAAAARQRIVFLL